MLKSNLLKSAKSAVMIVAINVFAVMSAAAEETLAQKLQNAADDSVISVSGEVALDDFVTINKKIALKGGEGGATISGRGGITIAEGGKLEVSGITFKDCTGSALILVDGGETTLENLSFENVVGTNYHSGAVAVLKGLVEIKNTTFTNCRADGPFLPSGRRGDGYGGAIYLDGSGCTGRVEKVTIADSYARNYGGGVYIGGGARLELYSPNKIKGNTSGTYNQVTDDVRIASSKSEFVVMDSAAASDGNAVGVCLYNSDLDAEEQIFAAISASATGATLNGIFNDRNGYVAKEGENNTLVWYEAPTIIVYPEPIAFKSIVRNANGTYTATLTNVVTGCWYYFYGFDSLANGVDTNKANRVSSFQATADGEMSFTLQGSGPDEFLKAVAFPGEIIR